MGKKIPCSIMRGGTSKGVFFWEKDLPADKRIKDKVILFIFGSPDSRQINGLGGADPLTSKCAIISPSSQKEADIDYTIGNVSITRPLVDYSSNCGNLSAAVAAFAVDEGLTKPSEPVSYVRMFNTNTRKIILAEVPTKKGKFFSEGSYSISGVPGKGSKILLDFKNTAGSVTGKLLPTGNVKDTIRLSDKTELEISIVDIATPMVFVRAKDLGLTGYELPAEINSNLSLLQKLEEIRGRTAEIIKVVDNWQRAASLIPATPKIAFVSPPQDYEDFYHHRVLSRDIDFTSRIMSMQKAHKAYAVTGSICTAVAAKIKGTLVNEALAQKKEGFIKFGHASGTIEIEIEVEEEKGTMMVKKAAVGRTARRIMDGFAFVPGTLFEE